MPSSLSSSECSETASDEPAPPAECLYADNPPLLHGKLQDMSGSNQWNDWRWQMRNRIRNAAQLVEYFPRMHIPPGLVQAGEKFPMAITPYYASLMEKLDSNDPIFQMCVPQIQELCDPPYLRDDPLEEDEDMPVPGLVHRYPRPRAADRHDHLLDVLPPLHPQARRRQQGDHRSPPAGSSR